MVNKGKMQQIVIDAYKTDPNLVNDDALLLAYVWGRFGWVHEASLEANLRRMPRAESITRARRKAHEDGLIKYSKEADDKRMEAFVENRDYYSQKTIHVPLEY